MDVYARDWCCPGKSQRNAGVHLNGAMCEPVEFMVNAGRESAERRGWRKRQFFAECAQPFGVSEEPSSHEGCAAALGMLGIAWRWAGPRRACPGRWAKA
jgi:hypothetical protein